MIADIQNYQFVTFQTPRVICLSVLYEVSVQAYIYSVYHYEVKSNFRHV